MFWRRLTKSAVLFGILGMSVLAVKSARAERVLTDYEASRLTLSALTSVPMVRHRSVSHQSGRTHIARAHSPHATVRNVAYHGHVVTPHKRNSHHRRG